VASPSVRRPPDLGSSTKFGTADTLTVVGAAAGGVAGEAGTDSDLTAGSY